MPQLSDATRDLFGIKTRGKILTTSLNCFNEDGFDRVSTAQLAETADVLEGTLWYHFRAKNDLVLAHLENFEARLDAHLATEIADRPDAIIADFLEIFVILWDFRYLLRDPLAALNDDDTVRVRLKETLQVIERSAEARILKSAEAGYIDLGNSDARSLAVSCTLIGRYWFDYARIRYSDDTHHSNLRRGCTEQMLAVLQPYFTQMAHELIARFKAEQMGSA